MSPHRLKPRRPGLLANIYSLLRALGLRNIENTTARRARLDRKAEIERLAKRRL